MEWSSWSRQKIERKTALAANGFKQWNDICTWPYCNTCINIEYVFVAMILCDHHDLL